MNPQEQIVHRLLQQKDRVQRMFSSGSRRLHDQDSWSFYPVAPDFGGRKYQLAAKKMQVLDVNKLGITQLNTVNRMTDAIRTKFVDPQNMLHLSRFRNWEGNSWSEVEQILPNQSLNMNIAPQETGELRRGSIIQKFNTFPQPNQPLESFKEQVHRDPIQRVQKPALPAKVSLSPKDKLFSRVQEMETRTPTKKDAGPSISAGKSQALPPVAREMNIQRKPEITSPSIPDAKNTSIHPVPRENIQRHNDGRQSSAPQQPDEVGPLYVPVIPQLNTEPSEARPVAISALDTGSDVQTPSVETSALATPMQAQPVTRSKTDAPDQSRPFALPTKKPGKIEHPSASVQHSTQSLPPKSEGMLNPVKQMVQRKSENNDSVQLPKPRQESDATSATSIATPVPIDAPVLNVHVEEPVPANTPSQTMHLRDHIERRQDIARRMTLHVGQSSSGTTIDRSKGMPLTVKDQPLVEPQKTEHYQVLRQDMKLVALPQAQAIPARSPDLPLIQRSVLPVALAQERVSDSRADIPNAVSISRQPVQNYISRVSRPSASPIQLAQDYLSETIDGAIDDISDPLLSAQTTLLEAFGQKTPKQQPQQRTESASLIELAEKIFPLVKHLLEIEFERTGRRFR